jgi:hypothetical protein
MSPIIPSTAPPPFPNDPTNHTPPQLFSIPTEPPDGPVHDGAGFNYYFLFLGAFVVLLAAFFWWLRQRRKQRIELLRRRGRHALARDLEGWAGGTRRYMHGRYSLVQTTARTRHSEGLDEHGQAPPPYEPKSEATTREATEVVPGVTIPLRTFARDEPLRTPPPQYDVATRASE